jgi:hypothetical protein
MSSGRKVTTAYELYVFTNVSQAARAGQGMYSYKELAEMVGLKPTQHFRKRINQMVHGRILKLLPAFTSRGGIENRFAYDTEIMQELPF